MKELKIGLNEQDRDRLNAVAVRRNMTPEDCATGLLQQSLRSWERAFRQKDSPLLRFPTIGPGSF